MKVELRHTFESSMDVYEAERRLRQHGYDLLMLPPSPLPFGPVREEVAGRNVISYRDGFEEQARRIRSVLEGIMEIDEVVPQRLPSAGLPEAPPNMPNLLNLINEEIVIYLNRVA
ncbi:MAG: hypothetical protein V2A77_07095 [Pseudomonadota bacterium]